MRRSPSMFDTLHYAFLVASLAVSSVCAMCGFMSPDEIAIYACELDTLGFEISSAGVALLPQACAEVVYVYV